MNTLQTQGSSALAAEKREVFHIDATVSQTPKKLRVAGYARVSSDSDDQLNSFSAQVRYYTKLIEKNDGWELLEVYADEGVTGVSTEKRGDFNRMIADCRKGKIDRIITKATSRFARNTLDSIRTIRELKDIGVTVFFEKENIDTAKLTGENLITLYSLFAQEESLGISQNMKRGCRMKMQSGEYVSSNPAYGYRLVDNQLTIYEPEAEVIRRIYAEYLGGMGANQIAKGLVADGVPFKNGGDRWRHQAVLNLIRNERYVGDMLLQKSYNEDTLPYRKCKNKGELPQYYVKNSHEPIVERIQYELANILLRERGKQVNTIGANYPLSRKIKCAECGTTYRRKFTEGTTYWVCRKHDEDKTLCNSQRITEDSVYRAFIRLYNKLRANYKTILLPLIAGLQKLRDAKKKDNIELNTINKQIAELSEQNHVMTGLVSKGILDSALFISQADELNRRIKALKLAKARLLEEAEGDGTLERLQELADTLEAGPDCLTEMDAAIFGDMVDKIVAADTSTLDFILVGGLTLTERMD